MLPEYKRRTNWGVGVGWTVGVIGGLMNFQGGNWVLLGTPLYFVGSIIFMYGVVAYIQGKGHSTRWLLILFLNIIGIIVIVLLPDRYKDFEKKDRGRAAGWEP